jgi:RHS repeat-associated protein
VAETNQDLIVTRFGYDGVGRLIAVTNGFGAAQTTWAQYQYDEMGNEIGQTDALARATIFTYDSMGRRLTRNLPSGTNESFTYDLAGNVRYHTSFNGNTITNVYDSLNRLLTRAYPDGTSSTFTFSPTGRRLTLTDSSGSYGYQYDSRDRLKTYTTPVASLNYGYDANGNVSSIKSSTPGGTSVTYQYDPLNRLTNVIDAGLNWTQTNTAYGYDSGGNLKSVQYPNTNANSCQYDSLNRLTNLAWVQGSTTIANFSYQLGAAGNKTNLAENVGGVIRGYAWQYDSLYRLTNENITGASPTGNLGYVYDLVGNRTSRTCTPNPVGTMWSKSYTYTSNDYMSGQPYDADGNPIYDGGTLSYDFEDRLISYNSITVGYNADGQMVKRVNGSATTLYLVDAANPTGYPQVLEEFNVNGTTNLAAVYTYGLSRISLRQPSGATNFYGYDGHGSTRFLLNPSGGITETYLYEAFGRRLTTDGSLVNNNFWYLGEYHDSGLGLYYMRARHYDPDPGRFLTMDTDQGDQEDPHSLHKYVYVENNPINRIDPSGHGSLAAAQLGTAVHNYIAADFEQKVKPFAVTMKSVATALKRFGINIDTITALFPDLVDINPQHKEVYEIKPAGLTSFAAGEFQLQGYLQLFNALDPTKGWEAGFHYTPPFVFVVSRPPLVPPTPVVAVGPIYGVIQYSTLSQYAKTKARNIAVEENAEEEETVLSSTLTTLMGGLF